MAPVRSRACAAREELVASLLEAGGLPTQSAHVVEVLAADLIVAHDLDLVNARRVEQIGALDADIVRDTADGEGAVEPRAAQMNDDALEDLDTLAIALDDLGVHAHGVAGLQRWNILAQVFFFDGPNQWR